MDEGEAAVYSMTGFGRGEVANQQRQIQVELKSVNHRYLDVSVRMPRALSFLEDALRKQLATRFARGHLDVYISLKTTGNTANQVKLDQPLLREYLQAIHLAKQQFDLADDFTLSQAIQLPDVLQCEQAPQDEQALLAEVLQAAQLAADRLLEMRASEGERLKQDILSRIQTLGALLEKVRERTPEVSKRIMARLRERIGQLLEQQSIDESRLAMEVALLAERSSITEEIVRLGSHLDQFGENCSLGVPIGRKLDFLVQEMHREVNTIGSKANDLEITNLVVEMKSEIEKIREQIQNIE